MANITKVVTDIIGTICPESGLKDLFANFRQSGPGFIARATGADLELIQKLENQTGKSGAELVFYIEEQMPLIKKAGQQIPPDYLALMGLVNAEGYETGILKCRFFPDVPGNFDKWTNNTLYISTFSNGSALSQRRMLRHGIVDGTNRQVDLSGLVLYTFDTAAPPANTNAVGDAVGNKYAPDSYRRIAKRLEVGTEDILFLSDTGKELDAACKAGCNVTWVNRPGNKETPMGYAEATGRNQYVSVVTLDNIQI